MEKAVKNGGLKTSVILEEYIPLKVFIERGDEPIEYLSYTKGRSSLLEIGVGMTSGLIKRVTLLLSREYDFISSELCIDDYKIEDLRLNVDTENNCSYFKTHLYANGVKIVVSEKTVTKYFKMDSLYIGVSNSGEIVEVSLCPLETDEIRHITKELLYQ